MALENLWVNSFNCLVGDLSGYKSLCLKQGDVIHTGTIMMTAQYQAALHSYAEGRYEEAMQQFSELLYQDPRNPKLHIWLGATFRKAGKIEFAKVQYQQVLTLTDDPDLLDLASTSLAQIQTKLANANSNNSHRKATVSSPEKESSLESIPLPLSSNGQSHASSAISNGNGNGNSRNKLSSLELMSLSIKNGTTQANSSKKLDSNLDSNNDHVTITEDWDTAVQSFPPLTNASKPSNSDDSQASTSIQSKSVAVPPPPMIAAQLKSQQQSSILSDTQITALRQPKDEQVENPQFQSSQSQNPEIADFESVDITEKAPMTSLLSATIATIQKGYKKSKNQKKPAKDKKIQTKNDFPSLGELIFGDEPSVAAIDPENDKDNTDIIDAANIADDKATSSAKPIAAIASLPLNNPRNSFRETQLQEKDSNAIALEDMFKVSSLGQKITLWGAFVATIPAIAVGLTAYHVGNGLLLNKVKQDQKSGAIAIAKTVSSFLEQQISDAKVLQKLLVSGEVGQNILQSSKSPKVLPKQPAKLTTAQSKQQITSRLELYAQAYPRYANIAIFSDTGELLAQTKKGNTGSSRNTNSANDASNSDSNKSLILDSAMLNEVSRSENVLLSEPLVKDGEAFLYALVPVKNSVSQKSSLVLRLEIPVDALVKSIANSAPIVNDEGKRDFYIIDSTNKYIASSQTVAIGTEALNDFGMLPDLRSAKSGDMRELVKGDRSIQMLAYAPILDMQSYGLPTWDVLTTSDKFLAMSGSQNLLLLITLGIAGTPLIVASLAYAISRKLSMRLKDIRLALKSLTRGDFDSNFMALSTAGNDELSDISASINTMSDQFHVIMQKQEQEKQRLQMQVVKLFKVLSKLARDEKQEVSEEDLSDQNILQLGKRVRAEMLQRNADAENFRHQKEELQGQLMQMLRDMQALANGDLTVATQVINSDLASVNIYFDDVTRGLQNIVGQVKSSANQLNFSLGQNEQAIANLGSVAQRQVDTVTRSLNAAHMSKLSATNITNSSHQIMQSSQTMTDHVAESDRSIDAVVNKVSALQNTVSVTAKRVKHLGEASQKIAKAMSAINEIAVKTNFLAISASLEASRTGDTGHGFVAVAEEVGELAARSVVASKEVEILLSDIQVETNEVMAVVESGSLQISESSNLAIAAKNSLLQIVEISKQIDGLMTSITDATASQVQTSEGVANLMQDIAHIAQRTLVSSTEVSKFMKATKQYSGDLQHSLTQFKTR
ncbi:hypothetical protein HCU40_03445 [Pseudanabaena biceps]|nr:hypothetical protein [Pseudanabaena biceps]